MRTACKFLLLFALTGPAQATDTQVEKAPEAPKAEAAKPVVNRSESVNTNNTNITIKHQGQARRETEVEHFCGTSKADCKKQCDDWLKQQKKSLGSSLKTSRCTAGKDLYGKENKEGCMNVECTGKITYVIKD